MSDEAHTPEMKDLTSTSFGYLIAFLLPGIFGLYALTYWFPQLSGILQPVLKADATVGPSAVFLLIALGMGLCVSALRFFVFEKVLCRNHRMPSNLFSLLSSENKLTTFKSVVDEHYRYHQFYGGCAVAFAILVVGWFYHHLIFDCKLLVYFGLVVAIELLLTVSAHDSFVRYVERGRIVVAGAKEDAKQIVDKEQMK